MARRADERRSSAGRVEAPEVKPAPSRVGVVRIGISGWRYKGWRGVFYPKGLQQRRELEFAAAKFRSIEINGTFYSLQRPAHFARWVAETPDDFVFSLKGSRFITHMKKLRGIESALANYLASGVLALGAKMGPVLWQFAPQMKFDATRFAEFFDQLPRTTAEAARIAKRCDARLLERSLLEPSVDMAMRHCVEIRDESFAVPEFIQLLRAHDIGLVVADTVEWPLLMDVTSDFVYCRLHGSEQLYASGYEDVALDTWAARVVAWATGQKAAGRCASTVDCESRPRDVFVYFDNDAKVRAPFDAMALTEKVERLLTP